SRSARASFSSAASIVRAPGGSSQNRSSRARCTSVPFAADGEGGSGRWSMAENRKASAQSLKDATFEGEREVGSGNGIGRIVGPPCDRDADSRGGWLGWFAPLRR